MQFFDEFAFGAIDIKNESGDVVFISLFKL